MKWRKRGDTVWHDFPEPAPAPAPRRKLTIEMEPWVEPVEPPPEPCAICDVPTPVWQKGGRLILICNYCRSNRKAFLAGWIDGATFDENLAIEDFATVDNLLRKEAYGRRI